LSAAAIARYLKDFDAPVETEAKRVPADAPVSADQAIPLPEPEILDPAAERAAAFEEGRQAAFADAAARQEEALRLQDEQHRLALDELTARYEGEIAATFSARFDGLATDVGNRLGRQVAELLAPLVERSVTDRMVGEFAAVISRAVGEGAAVTVGGPKALFARLAASPELAGADLRHVETEEPDLSIEFASTLIATRLAAWTDELREVLS